MHRCKGGLNKLMEEKLLQNTYNAHAEEVYWKWKMSLVLHSHKQQKDIVRCVWRVGEGKKWGKGGCCAPWEGLGNQRPMFGEQNAPHWHLHCSWKWVVAKRAKTWSQERASASTHPPQVPQTCPWICMVLTNASLGILLNLPVGHIK